MIDLVIPVKLIPVLVFLASNSETALDAIKLGDFGIGAVLQEKDLTTYVGTDVYRPPVITTHSQHELRY